MGIDRKVFIDAMLIVLNLILMLTTNNKVVEFLSTIAIIAAVAAIIANLGGV